MKKAVLLNLSLVNEETFESLVGTLESEHVIGTSEGADFKLDDWRCSGIHALIKTIDKETFRIIDLGSTYGTFAGSEAFSQQDFKTGETFRVGNHHLKIALVNETDLKTLVPYAPSEHAKEKMPDLILSADKTVLEVSLFWGEKLLEVKQFISGEKISIGNPKDATFGVPEELLPGGFEKGVFTLASFSQNKLNLSVPKAATGLLWTDEKVLNLDTLRLYKNLNVQNGMSQISLRLGDKAHVELGELIFSFRFIHPAKKIRKRYIPSWNKQITKILASIILFYAFIFFFASLSTPEPKITKIEDIPKHLKKTIYDTGIKSAKKKQQSAVGEIATDQGGRARSEEGKASAKKEVAEKSQEKVKADKPVQANAQKSKAPISVATAAAAKNESVDFDKAFQEAAPSEMTATSAIVSNAKVNGVAAVAIANGGFARGSKGLGMGGGGESVGVGALKGSGMGGGMGAGDYGLNPSKGTELKVPAEEDVEIVGGLDHEVIARIIKRYLPQIQYCYEQQLVSKPSLKGKVAVSFTIKGDGSVGAEKITETTLKDRPTEACILARIKHWKFPKPLGGGTVGVNYPFILMSNNSK